MRMTLLTRLERACDNGMVGGVWPKIDSHCDKEEGGQQGLHWNMPSHRTKEDLLEFGSAFQMIPAAAATHFSIVWHNSSFCLVIQETTLKN